MRAFLKKCLMVVLIGAFLSSSLAYAQEAAVPAAAARPPVMKSIFWNTVLGSAWGAVMGTAAALGSPKTAFRESLVLGTTLGGIIGYGFGVFLVIRGISFDPSTLPVVPTTPLGMAPVSPIPPTVTIEVLPFSKEMKFSAQSPKTQWQTPIFQLTF